MDEEADLSAEKEEISDKSQVFFTNAGRKVYGSGGVIPDVEIPEEVWKPIEYNLVRKNMFFEFAIEYTTKMPGLAKDFKVTDEIVAEFRDFIKAKGFDYKTALELDLEKFEATAESLNKAALFHTEISELRAIIAREKEKDFDESIDYIRQSIKREMLRKEYGERGIYEELTLKEDRYVREAVDLLKNTSRYGQILKPQPKDRG